MFCHVVTEFWDSRFSSSTAVATDGDLTVVITPHLEGPAALLSTPGEPVRMAVSPAVAEANGLAAGACSAPQVHQRLAFAGITLDDAAELYYWPESAKDALLAETSPAQVRPLASADAGRFATFTAACSADDLDEAEVALDDWDVLGVVSGDALVAAASAYLVAESQIADLGVITHPDHRGDGHARALVRTFSRRLLTAGYEPQYRCDPGNRASAAVARSAGLARFGTWTTVADG